MQKDFQQENQNFGAGSSQHQQQQQTVVKKQKASKPAKQKKNKNSLKLNEINQNAQSIKNKKQQIALDASKIVQKYYGFKPTQVSIVPEGNQCQNFYVNDQNTRYVLKFQKRLPRCQQPAHPQQYFHMNMILVHLAQINQKRMKSKQAKIIAYPELIPTKDGQYCFKQLLKEKQGVFRIFKFIQGQTMKHFQKMPQLYEDHLEDLSRKVGIMHRDLQSYKYLEQMQTEKYNATPQLKIEKIRQRYSIEGQQTIQLFGEQLKNNQKIKTYHQEIIEVLSTMFPKCLQKAKIGIVHQDLHRNNVLMDQQAKEIVGIIDFGHSLKKRFIVFDLLFIFQTLVYNKPKDTEIEYAIKKLCEIIRGYSSQSKLSQYDIQCLFCLLADKILTDQYAYSKNRYIRKVLLQTNPNQLIKFMKNSINDKLMNF